MSHDEVNFGLCWTWFWHSAVHKGRSIPSLVDRFLVATLRGFWFGRWLGWLADQVLLCCSTECCPFRWKGVTVLQWSFELNTSYRDLTTASNTLLRTRLRVRVWFALFSLGLVCFSLVLFVLVSFRLICFGLILFGSVCLVLVWFGFFLFGWFSLFWFQLFCFVIVWFSLLSFGLVCFVLVRVALFCFVLVC
jgi:hypothetical protein